MESLYGTHLEEMDAVMKKLVDRVNLGAKEIKEETGYTVDIKGIVQIGDAEMFKSFIFLCEIDSNQEYYNSEGLLSIEWLSLDEIKNIKDKLRSPELTLDAIKNVEDKKVCSLDIIKQLIN